MIKKMLALSLLFPFSAFGASISEVEQIIAVGAANGSGLMVKFKTSLDVPGPNSCSSKYHYLDASTEKGKLIVSMLLSARVSTLPVEVHFDGNGCSGTKGIISGISL